MSIGAELVLVKVAAGIVPPMATPVPLVGETEVILAGVFLVQLNVVPVSVPDKVMASLGNPEHMTWGVILAASGSGSTVMLCEVEAGHKLEAGIKPFVTVSVTWYGVALAVVKTWVGFCKVEVLFDPLAGSSKFHSQVEIE
jgi:hypothetical protein